MIAASPKGGCETNALVGDDSDGGPPDPIPNSAVKPDHADGTARVTLWESRYRRPSFTKTPRGFPRGVFRFVPLVTAGVSPGDERPGTPDELARCVCLLMDALR